MSEEFPVLHNPAKTRFEISLAAERAVLEYRIEGRRMIFTHTEVPPSFRGRGLAEKIVLAGLQHAQDHGLEIVPACSYVEAILKRHPEFSGEE